MTPDDHTRRCAAEAANVELVRHAAAVKEIEKQFGDDAYPLRVVMADLPESASLIPNPVNRIPGFSVDHHHFLPGFPAMAHPMAEWVLENRYTAVTNVLHQRSVRVTGTTETAMLATLQALADSYPEFKLYSLPHMGDKPCIEIGFRGRDNLDVPFNALLAHLKKDKIKFEITPGSGVSET
jgi:molybdopterin-biosynthesis enzyme MoeA-like protein